MTNILHFAIILTASVTFAAGFYNGYPGYAPPSWFYEQTRGSNFVDDCERVSPPVRQFTETFVDGIYSNYKLTDAFTQRQISSEEAGQIVRYLLSEVSDDLGAQEDNVATRILSDAIGKNFQKATPGQLITMYAKNTGEALQILGVLNEDNAYRLGWKFLMTTKERIDEEPDDSDSEMQLESIVAGFIDFLKSIGQYKEENEPVFAAVLAQEWYKL